MNSKTIIKIIILILLLASLITILILGFTGKLNFSWENKTDIIYNETFDNIRSIETDLTSYDIEIKENNTNELKVVVSGSKKYAESIEVKSENNKLLITQKSSKMCVGLCFFDEKITIYLPKENEIELNHQSSSGNIDIETTLISGNIKTTSGDVKINSLNEVIINSTSGNITIEEGNNLEVSSTSGDITIDKVATLKATSKSGNQYIEQIKKEVQLSAKSGDITINKFYITEDSNIKTTSGNVALGLENEIFINTTTKSGNIDINNTNKETILNIKTTSGDITAK